MLTPALGLLLSLALTAQEAAPGARPGQVEEHVTVERVVLTGRVIDRYANPIRELGVHDFRLRVDGQETPIESVDWNPVPPKTEQKPSAPGRPVSVLVPESPSGRQLIVMLFQWELAGQKDTGFVRMMRQAMQFVDASADESRFAVLAFGSSLHLLQDFTTDRAAIRRAIEAVRNPAYSGSGGDAASSVRDIHRCRADSIERAFVCIGNELQPIPGPKSVLFFGWTVSSYRSSWRTRYPDMIDAVRRSDVTVFSLDVSNGRHSLGDKKSNHLRGSLLLAATLAESCVNS